MKLGWSIAETEGLADPAGDLAQRGPEELEPIGVSDDLADAHAAAAAAEAEKAEPREERRNARGDAVDLPRPWPSQRQRMSTDDVSTGCSRSTSVGLGDLEVPKVKAAVTRLARTSEWLPTIAAIRAAVGVVEHGEQSTGAEAWETVLSAIRRHGSHRTPGIDISFGDPITACGVVKALNWGELLRERQRDRGPSSVSVDAYADIAKTERREAQAAPGATNPQLERGPSSIVEIETPVTGRTSRDLRRAAARGEPEDPQPSPCGSIAGKKDPDDVG